MGSRVAMDANWEGEGAIAPPCPYVAPPLVIMLIISALFGEPTTLISVLVQQLLSS